MSNCVVGSGGFELPCSEDEIWINFARHPCNPLRARHVTVPPDQRTFTIEIDGYIPFIAIQAGRHYCRNQLLQAPLRAPAQTR
jgi:hypothetical protein